MAILSENITQAALDEIADSSALLNLSRHSYRQSTFFL
jgi:hypothetical protein